MAKAFSGTEFTALQYIGNTLGPVFLQDPKESHETYELLKALKSFGEADVIEWPYLEEPRLKEIFGELDAWDGELNEALYGDFRRLFIGPARLAAPPYGSVYTDSDLVMFGKSCMELREWLRANGINMQSDNMPEDHVGKLMLLMAWLADAKPDLLTEFLEQHFLPVGPYIFEEIYKNAQHPVYKALAILAKETLEAIELEHELKPRYLRKYR